MGDANVVNTPHGAWLQAHGNTRACNVRCHVKKDIYAYPKCQSWLHLPGKSSSCPVSAQARKTKSALPLAPWMVDTVLLLAAVSDSIMVGEPGALAVSAERSRCSGRSTWKGRRNGCKREAKGMRTECTREAKGMRRGYKGGAKGLRRGLRLANLEFRLREGAVPLSRQTHPAPMSRCA